MGSQKLILNVLENVAKNHISAHDEHFCEGLHQTNFIIIYMLL